jgi:hypothetical protein
MQHAKGLCGKILRVEDNLEITRFPPYPSVSSPPILCVNLDVLTIAHERGIYRSLRDAQYDGVPYLVASAPVLLS